MVSTLKVTDVEAMRWIENLYDKFKRAANQSKCHFD
jgi:hypothetical protein